MWQGLKLMLPALVPSWRFFDMIAPSPRIEYRLFDTGETPITDWQEYRPRPRYLSIFAMAKRMVWNPNWNEMLYLVSCSERIMAGEQDHSARQIQYCLRRDVKHQGGYDALQFRLVFLHREGEEIRKDVGYISPLYPRGNGVG
ncbi:MAG: hypothetical protein CMH27_07970 [Micavibrio sp.]|nr:hypothetical protein [Micavibrio sp.]|tara:strand:- start:1222 stop:1650 length:429 start_codon:yes stop_codon:yes gene_type:complete